MAIWVFQNNTYFNFNHWKKTKDINTFSLLFVEKSESMLKCVHRINISCVSSGVYLRHSFPIHVLGVIYYIFVQN